MTRLTWQQAIDRERPLLLPGAYDALSARLIKQAGFSAYVIGGFSLVAARYGLPDLGLVGLGEMAAGVTDIIAASDLPVLVDVDHGYGGPQNIAHTIRTYERLGVAAVFLEDQRAPKRCGHVVGKDVVSTEEMEERIRAAVAARSGADLFLIARTDARAVHGLDDALRRGERYLRAGADGLFIEAPRSVEELEIIGRAFDVPQFCNMLPGGQTPILSNADLYGMGYRMVVHGTTLAMAVAAALEQVLTAIRNDRPLNDMPLMPLDSFKTAMGYAEWLRVAEQNASTAP